MAFRADEDVDADVAHERMRARLLVHLSSLLAVISLVFSVIHFALPIGLGPGAVNLLGFVASGLILLQIRFGVARTLCVYQFIGLLTGTLTALSFFTGGVVSPVMAWMSMVPVFGLALDRPRTAALGSLFVVVAVIGLGAMSAVGMVAPNPMTSPTLEIMASTGFLVLIMSLFVVGSMSERMRHLIKQDLERTNERLQNEVDRHDETRRRLQRTHRQLVDAARVAGAAEVATGVLHNLGNALNAVNVSGSLIDAQVAELRLDRVERLTMVLEDERARRYVVGVHGDLERARRVLHAEVESMRRGVDHAMATVAAQQRHAGQLGVLEPVELQELLDDVLLLAPLHHQHAIDVQILCGDVPRLIIDRHRLVQVVFNLVSNAHDAIRDRTGRGRIVVVGSLVDDGMLEVSVTDDGVGIAHADLDRVFSHGFTTKSDGHGFGLHACALSANEVGGALAVRSDGPGRGATFTLRLPVEAAFTTQHSVRTG